MQVKTADRLNGINEYYFATKLRQIREMNQEGADIINLGPGNPDNQPPAEVIEAAVRGIISDKSHGYQPYRGIPELREAFSSWYSRVFGTLIDPAGEILPLMGSKEGIMHISMAFLNRGDGVLIPDPGYPSYASAAHMCGARIVHYTLEESKGWLPDLEKIEGGDIEGIKLMWVNYPNMPTGARGNAAFLEKLVNFARRNRILVVNDNPYSLLLNDNPLSILSVDGGDGFVLELNSLSKAFNMAGWRIGMVAGNSNLIDAVVKVKSNMDSGMFLPLQQAAVVALGMNGEWTRSLNEMYRLRREKAAELLRHLGSEYSEAQSGMFLWSKLPHGWSSSVEYSDMLLERYGIFITPGSVFGSNGRQFIRTSLCVPESEFDRAMERLEMKDKR